MLKPVSGSLLRLGVAAAVAAALCLVAAGLGLPGTGVWLTQIGPQRVVMIRTAGERIRIELIFSAAATGPSPHPALHYTEHLAWLNAMGPGAGTESRHSNAWTNDHAVGYRLSGERDGLSETLESLLRLFHPITLPRRFAESEREVILREYEHRIVDNPDARANEAIDAILYEGNSIAASVIGTPEGIMALDYGKARTLHTSTHRPENSTLVVVGDVTGRQLRRALNRVGWPRTWSEPIRVDPPPFSPAPPVSETLSYPDVPAAPRMIVRRVASVGDPVQFDLLEARTAVLSHILKANLPGGLAGPLRFDAAIARSFDIWIRPIDEGNIEMGFTAAPDQGVSLAELRAAFDSALASSSLTGIPASTYDRVRGRFDEFWPDWSDDDETADWLADYALRRLSGLRLPLSRPRLRRLERGVSHDATNELLRRIASGGRTVTAFIGPQDSFQ